MRQVVRATYPLTVQGDRFWVNSSDFTRTRLDHVFAGPEPGTAVPAVGRFILLTTALPQVGFYHFALPVVRACSVLRPETLGGFSGLRSFRPKHDQPWYAFICGNRNVYFLSVAKPDASGRDFVPII